MLVSSQEVKRRLLEEVAQAERYPDHPSLVLNTMYRIRKILDDIQLEAVVKNPIEKLEASDQSTMTLVRVLTL